MKDYLLMFFKLKRKNIPIISYITNKVSHITEIDFDF
jgi:hypothetical protein